MGINNWRLIFETEDHSIQQQYYSTEGIPPIRVHVTKQGWDRKVLVDALNDALDWRPIVSTGGSTATGTDSTTEEQLIADAVDAAEKILARHPKYAEPI